MYGIAGSKRDAANTKQSLVSTVKPARSSARQASTRSAALGTPLEHRGSRNAGICASHVG
jgi:hypothetical protein